MTKYRISFAIIIVCILTFGCKKLDEVNANPNAPEVVNPQFLLSNVISEASNNQAFWGWHAGNLLAQHASNLEFLPIDRYDLGNNEGLWTATYRLLNDLETIMTSDEGNEAYTAVAKILKAHQASLLTDLWTDVPFFDAIKGQSEGNFTPKFDSQESIYMNDGGILHLLEEATETLAQTSETIAGDILYNGNLNQWIKFANSLRVRYLVRISAKVDVSDELQSIVNDGMLFANNTDNASVPYLTSAPNQWVIFNEREGRYVDVRMSTTGEGILENIGDPRIGVFYKPTINSQGTTPVFTGIPNGLSRENINNFDLSDVSLMGSFLRDEPNGVQANFMTYPELMFCLAEAAQKGYISGGANMYYELGIQGSFDYYETTVPADYFSNPQVMLAGGDDLDKIMTQKWISSFLNGYEAWFDIRRTQLPEIIVPTDNLNGNIYPVRYQYPTSEQAVNGANYSAAVSQIGGDTYNSKGWWEQ